MTDLSTMTCIEDLRRVYRRRVPKMFVDYCESGSWTESTLRANVEDFERLKFRQKVLVDMEGRSLKTTLLGQEAAMPLALAPVGLTGMQRADGEILAARAAEAFGVPYILSTMSICSIEDVAAATTKPFWFQLYMMRDRGFMRDLIARIRQAGCSALILTADLQILGQRHRDIKNGLTTPPKPTLVNLADMALKLPWLLAMRQTPRRGFGNIVGHMPGVSSADSLSRWTAEQFDPKLSWDDVAWVKNEWGGKLVIKGIMEADDARRAVAAGADAIVVSNHGGRQLDGAPSSIAVLPEIVDAVSGSLEVWLDGGIRTGQNLLRALALGARGVLIGRSYIYGLGAFGQAGVTRALEILYKEADLSMAFCGLTDIRQVNADILRKAP